jgi:hypothetical protein
MPITIAKGIFGSMTLPLPEYPSLEEALMLVVDAVCYQITTSSNGEKEYSDYIQPVFHYPFGERISNFR